MTLKEFGVSAVTAAILSVSGAAIAADSGTVVANQAQTTKSSQASQQKSILTLKAQKVCWQNIRAYFVKSIV